MVNLKLSCLVGWESTSRAFLISASSTLTITDLKELIKAEKVPEFDEIAAENLILWRILVPVIATRGHDSVKLDALDDKEELPPSDDLLDFFPDTPAKKAIHIIVELPPLGSSVSAALSLPLKRGREQELEDPQKLPKTDDWVKYNAKDRAVDLPPLLVSMLNAGEFTPEPRDEFKQQLDDMQVGQQIILPSIGQRPKHYGQGYQKLSFFITEQMVEMWRLLSSNNDRPIRRILSGPVGVGKSYLALFLATKAYAEAWPLLYFSDAKKLALSDGYDVAQEIYERFLALNKDILTVTDSQESTHGHPTGSTVVIHAATSILGRLLQQRETKTLLVVDGHGALFEQDPPVPKKYMIFNPLMQLAAWRENSRGARVVMAGTAEKFERHCIKNDMWNWLEYVTPLSDTIFDKLLDMDAILSRAAIREQVKKTTNRAPRELVSMAAFICQNVATTGQQSATIDPNTYADQVVLSRMRQFAEQRHRAFYLDAYFHFRSLGDIQRHSHRHALAAILLPRKEGEFDFEYRGFDYQFMDLGLVTGSESGFVQNTAPYVQLPKMLSLLCTSLCRFLEIQ